MSTAFAKGRVVIIGGGAMGSLLAARLATAGIDATVIDTWREHVEASRATALRWSRTRFGGSSD